MTIYKSRGRTIRAAVLAAMMFTTVCTTVGQSAGDKSPVNERIRQLEEQLAKITQELAKIKLVAVDSSEAKPVAAVSLAAAARPEPKADAKPAASQSIGINLGSVRLVPYGTIYFNAFSNSGGTNNTDVPLFATPNGPDNASASLRQTRFGVRVDGAKLGAARLGAVIEADFFGGFPGVGIGENFGIVRLRLANVRLDWEKTSLTAGQDWMVFAPQNPTSLAAAAIPQMAAAGNNWGRLPLVKIEHKSEHFTFQGAVLAPQTGDSVQTASFFLQPTSGASSRVPFFQGRVAFSDADWFNTRKGGTIGLSGHFGRSKVFTGTGGAVENDIESVGLALDWNIPLHVRLALSGEAFFGRNLGGFQAGIFQSYNTDFAYRVGTTLVAAGVRSIGTRGGWAQAAFTPPVFKDKLTLYGSVGIDDPTDTDLISRSPRDFRQRNFAYTLNAIYKITPQFQFGGEFRSFVTSYVLSGRRTAAHTNLTLAYSF